MKVEWRNKKQALRQVDKLSYQIMDSRKGFYQDNWALMSLDSLLSGAMYKCDRARTTFDLAKKLDDVLDAINYLRFVAVRLLELKDKHG
ncbi:MAG: hypothetical protein QXQ50_02135 [Candidatus Bathyarchaeia archaeon]